MCAGDIRPAWQRESVGEIRGSVIVERNHLEWSLHPKSGASLPPARDGREWIVVCTEGCTSSLAASALLSLGLRARDIVARARRQRHEHVMSSSPRTNCWSVGLRQDCPKPVAHVHWPAPVSTALCETRRTA